MAKKESRVKIFISRGMQVTSEIYQLVGKEHPDWKILDYSDFVTDDELYATIQELGLKRFPIVMIDERVTRYQGENVKDLMKYIERKLNPTQDMFTE